MWLFKTKICGLFLKQPLIWKCDTDLDEVWAPRDQRGSVLMYPPRASSPRLDVLTFAADSYVPVVVKHEI